MSRQGQETDNSGPAVLPVRPDAGRRLDGWKEISTHLRCDVRTCMRWEKEQGLPIHRINHDAKKSKVFAFTAELDAWLRRGRPSNGAPHEGTPRPWLAKSWKIVAAAVVVAMGLAAILILAPKRGSGPAKFGVVGSTLQILDGAGQFLWPLEIPAMGDQKPFYDSRAAASDPDPSLPAASQPKVVFFNLDRDRSREVALFLNNDIPEKRGVAVYDDDGTPLWFREVRYDVAYARTRWSKDFVPVQLATEDINGDGRPEIIALWRHVKECPGLLQVFSSDGEEIGHYDHTGTLLRFALHRRKDGAVEILLGGTNNLLDGDAVLIGLDGRSLPHGLGPPYDVPEDLKEKAALLAPYVPRVYKPASQKYYLRIRHNEISRSMATFWMWIVGISTSSESITLTLPLAKSAILYYDFSADVVFEDIRPGSDFIRFFPEWQARGIVSVEMADFLDRCRKGVFFWNGKLWKNLPPGTGPSRDQAP
jgi:hypothetical protein